MSHRGHGQTKTSCSKTNIFFERFTENKQKCVRVCPEKCLCMHNMRHKVCSLYVTAVCLLNKPAISILRLNDFTDVIYMTVTMYNLPVATEAISLKYFQTTVCKLYCY